MHPRDARLLPTSPRHALLLLVPLALLAIALLALLAGPASASHPLNPPTITGTPGAVGNDTTPSWTYSVETGDTATCTLTNGSGTVVESHASCPYPTFTAAPLTADGSYTFSVSSVRAASDTEAGGTSAPATSSYLLDTTAPALTLTAPASANYSASTGWTLGISDGGSTVTPTCTLTAPDGSITGFTCNEGSVKPALTTSGTYTVTANARDAAGNTATAVSASYTYDGTPPTVTLTAEPTGPSSATNPTWQYSVVDGNAPTCVLTGPTTATRTTVACGASSYTASLTASGEYTLTVTATDDAGNSASDTSLVYVLDITGPGITVTPGTSTGTGDSVSWTVTITDATTASCTVTGATSSTSSCSATGGTVSATLAADGTVTLTVSATDAYSNSSSTSVSYTRDTTPAAPTVTAPPSPDNKKSVQWSFTTDSLTTTVSCRLVRGTLEIFAGACTTFANGAGTFSATLTDDGVYTLHVTADNDTSTATATGSASYTLDTSEPAGPTLAQTHTGTTGTASPIGWTWTVLDGHMTSCRLTVAGTVGTWGECNGSFSTATGTEGTYLLEVQYVDALGNRGTISSANYLYDSVAPAAPGVTLVGDSPRQPGTVQWDVTTGTDVAFSECRVIGPGVDPATVAWATCTLPVVRTLSGDGTHVVEVRHVDSAGNRSPVGTSSVVIDGTTPTAPTVTGGPSTSTSTTLAWTLAHTASDGASFLCRLLRNGTGPADFTACNSNYSTTVTEDGVYTLEVMSVDTVGNRSPVTTSESHTVDRTGPAAPTVTLAVTSGNTTSATWSVALAADATRAECRLRYTDTAGRTTVGAWATCSTPYTFALSSGDGVYALEVRSYDALGNLGGATTGPGYTLDATPPAAPTVTGSRDGMTDNERAVSYTYSGEGTATCYLYRGTTLVTPADAVCGATRYTATLPATDGTYRLEVTFTDAFGNTGARGISGDYTLDVTPPATPTVTGLRDGTTDNELAVSYTYSGEGTATCYLYRGTTLVTPADAVCGATRYTATLPATDGTYRLEVTFTDAVGNTGGRGISGNYTLDVTPPGLATVTVTPRTDKVASATWTVTPPESGTTSECRLTHTAGGVTTEVFGWKACAAPYSFDLRSGDGAYVLEIRLTDAVGNLGGVAVGQSYTLDTTPPAVPTVTSDRTGTDNERTVTYTFSGEGTATCTLLRGGTVVQGPVTCTSTYTVLLPDVSGSYVLQVTYTDAVGNVSAPGSSPVYELDVTPPAQPVVTSDRTGTDNERTVTYTFSGEGTATCTLLRDGVVVSGPVACSSPWVVTLPATDGSYVLQVTYTDAVGNTSTAGASPTYLLDLTAPPAPAVAGPSGTDNERTVTWTYSGEGTATCTLLLGGTAVGAPFACDPTGYTTTLPSDGAWSLRVTFTDAVGNTGLSGTSPTYLLDTAAPPAPVLTGPTGPSSSRAVSWSLSTEAGTTLVCRLVRGSTVILDWVACSGAFAADLTGLPDGAYVLESRATDAAGNVSATGAATPYVLDTTKPLAPVVSGPSGPSQLRTPGFTWTGEAGTTAQCRLTRDGAVVGTWVDCTSGFAPLLDRDGTWTLAVRLTDAAGNVGEASSSGGYVLDTTAPAAPVVTPPRTPGRDLAPSWGAVVEGGTTLECRLTGPDGLVTGWDRCEMPYVTSLSGRPDGAYLLEVRATDAAGNASPVGSARYVLDTVAPAAAVVTSPPSPGRTRTPSFTFTTEAGASTTCRLTSGSTLLSDFAPCTSPAALDLSGLPDGTYTLTVRVTDAAGNPGPAATGTYVLDTTAPAAPVFTLTPATPSPARSVTWELAFERGSTLDCRLTLPNRTVRVLSGCTSPLTLDLSGLPDGTYLLSVRAIDAAGNAGPAATSTHVIDSGALAAPVLTPPATPGSTRTPTWSFTSPHPTQCRLTRGATVLRDWATCSGSYTADLFGQPNGTYTLSVRARDAEGRLSAAATSSYALDTTPPAAATLVAPPSPSTNRLPTWSIASPEAGATAMCRVLVFDSVLKDWAPCAVSAGGSLYRLDLTGLGDGTYTLVVRLTDAAGNVGTTLATSSYVLDTSAPAAVGVTGPPSPGNDDTPTWLLSTGGSTLLQCRLTSKFGVVSDWLTCAGQYSADLTDLPDGTYTLSVRAVSQAGTPGPETTSAYVLSRTLPGAPTALALSGVTSPSNDRAPAWTFTLPAGTTGVCRVVQGTRVLYDGPCSSPFRLDLSAASDGTYTLTVVAVDAAGNLSPAASSNYVLDTEPTAAPDFTQVPGASGSTLDPQWRFTVARGASAECRLLYQGRALDDWVACTGLYTALLSGRPDGTYTLQVRAVDAAGNTSEPESDSYRLDRSAAPVPTFLSTPPTPSKDPTVSWTVSAPAGSTLECRLVAPDGVTDWGTCSTYRLGLSGRPDGAYVLEVQVVDADGRRGSVSRATYVYDTQAPDAPTFSDRPPLVGKDHDPTWLWDAGGEDLLECRLVREGGAQVTGWAECSTGQYVADLSRLGDGTYALQVRLTDAAGNVSGVTAAAYRYDTQAPARPVFTSRPPSGGADRTISWTFSVPADARATCTVTRDFTVVRREAPCAGRYDLDLAGLPDGTYTLTVRYTDAAGNVSSPAAGTYALATLRAGGPIRVDPPLAPRPDGPVLPGAGGSPSLPRTGRGGTPPAEGSTTGPVVPTLPRDDDVARSSESRPGVPLTAAPPESRDAAGASSDPEPRRSGNPLLPHDFGDAPEVIRDLAIGTIKRPTLPLALLAIVVLFLLAQNRIDRRDPKLAHAPVEAEPELDFTAFVRRPGGALS